MNTSLAEQISALRSEIDAVASSEKLSDRQKFERLGELAHTARELRHNAWYTPQRDSAKACVEAIGSYLIQLS